MHILVVGLHRPEKPTGVCRHAANLANCLADRPEVSQVTLVAGAWQIDYFKTAFALTSAKIKLVGIMIKNNSLSRNRWFLQGLPQFVHQLQPDLVHLSFPLPFLRSRFVCPVVTTIHDLYPFEMPENFGKQAILNRLILRACVHQSDGLTCVSNTTLDSLKHYFPQAYCKKLTAVIYNYVDFTNLVPDCPQLQPAGDSFWVGSHQEEGETLINIFPNQRGDNSLKNHFLLCVAQHRKNKNLDVLIDAFAQLKRDRVLANSFQLMIVGSAGPETDALHRQVKTLNLQKDVHFIAAIHDRELCYLYQQCALFVIASAVEGFCLPLAEALSLGCQVVCSNIPVLREIGSAHCTYFDLQGDRVANLAAAITEVWQHPGAEPTTDSRFSKARAAAQLLAFYPQVR